MRKRLFICVFILMIIVLIGIITYTSINYRKKNNNITQNVKIERISTYNNPIIPEGFSTIETDSASWSLEDGIPKGWNSGLVIEDEIGNQFVWIPIKVKNSNQSEVNMDNVEEVQLYKYGGFYVSRYEAGIPNDKIEKVNETEIKIINANAEGKPTSKKNQIVWNNINVAIAEKNAINMYKNNKFVKSDLITEGQWRYLSQWLSECGYDIKNSKDFGNYSNANFLFTGYYSTDGRNYKYAKNKMKQTYNMLLSTGATERNKSNNIYDLAGNVAEFLKANSTSNNSYDKGGYYDNVSSYGIGGIGGIPISDGNDRQGFRIVLYIQ